MMGEGPRLPPGTYRCSLGHSVVVGAGDEHHPINDSQARACKVCLALWPGSSTEMRRKDDKD